MGQILFVFFFVFFFVVFFFFCNTGVRQGDNLSPVLLSIFMNDLELLIDNVDGIRVDLTVYIFQNICTAIR